MKEISPKEWEKDFHEFLDAPEAEPSRAVSDRILETVSKDLNPSASMVFLKLLGITAASGVLSLTICPQSGLGQGIGLMRFFMQLGPHVCSIACGAIFISIGIILSFFLLRPEELRVLRRTRFLQLTVLAMTSLLGFICAGAQVLVTIAAFWLFGAMVGGLLTLEVSYRIKFLQVGIN